MRIKAKLLWTSVGMSLLVALVGGIAVNRQQAAGVLEVKKEAENTARVISFTFAAEDDPSHPLTQELIRRLYHALGRDVEVLGADKRILADAIPKNVGTVEHDADGALDESMRDGEVRTFIEISEDYPHGIRQIAVPVKAESGEVTGAVILEYTPHYNEMLALTKTTSQEVAAAALASGVIALLLALWVGNSITAPLWQLTKAAKAFATGRNGVPMPPQRGDEIGELTTAFNVMIEKRQQAQDALTRMNHITIAEGEGWCFGAVDSEWYRDRVS